MFDAKDNRTEVNCTQSQATVLLATILPVGVTFLAIVIIVLILMSTRTFSKLKSKNLIAKLIIMLNAIYSTRPPQRVKKVL